MQFSLDIINQLLDPNASKALATMGSDGLNVVPVSTIKVINNKIWLIDYFFGKTRQNLQQNPKEVSLVFWSGLKGFQLKSRSTYLTTGDDFKIAQDWIAQLHPERTIKGLVVLEPNKIYDISIG